MTTGLLIVGAVHVLAMVAIAQYGWRMLPDGAHVPLHWGPASWNNWVSKNVALVVFPAIGLAVYVVMAVTLSAHRSNRLWGLVLALIVIAIAECGAIRAGLRRVPLQAPQAPQAPLPQAPCPPQ
jgi:hypothetical protein